MTETTDTLAGLRAATEHLTPDTPEDEARIIVKNTLPLLVDLSHADVETAIELIGSRCSFKKAWLNAIKKDVIALRKRKDRDSGRDSELTLTASLPGLVDLVDYEGSPAFLMLDEDGVSIAPEAEHDGLQYAPPPREQIPWLLPRGQEVVAWYERKEVSGVIYDDVRVYYQQTSELPGETYYDLLTVWTFHTHLPEPCHYSPEICFDSVPERGKSRTGKAMIYVARRGIHVESLRDAYLVRMAHNCQSTIFFDVMDLWKKAEKAGSEDIILGRFERGITVPRVLYPDRGAHRDTVYYDIFGPTVIATNVSVHRILDTRAVQINMPQSDRRFELDLTPEYALPLKERLTAWRAHHLGESLPEITKPARGRLGDILKPLVQTIRLVKPEREPELVSLIRQLERNRMIDKAESFEGQILLQVGSLRDQVDKGIIPVKVITDHFNENRPENSQVTYQRMGRKLASLGFEKGKTSQGAAALIWDEEKLQKNLQAYGLGKTSVMPETSEIPENTRSREPDIVDESPETPEETPGHESPMNSHVTDQTDITDVFSSRYGGKKTRTFFDEIDPEPDLPTLESCSCGAPAWDVGHEGEPKCWGCLTARKFKEEKP